MSDPTPGGRVSETWVKSLNLNLGRRATPSQPSGTTSQSGAVRSLTGSQFGSGRRFGGLFAQNFRVQGHDEASDPTRSRQRHVTTSGATGRPRERPSAHGSHTGPCHLCTRGSAFPPWTWHRDVAAMVTFARGEDRTRPQGHGVGTPVPEDQGRCPRERWHHGAPAPRLHVAPGPTGRCPPPRHAAPSRRGFRFRPVHTPAITS